MSLQLYQHKRRFNRTPEPRGKPARPRGPLRFVVQKHLASHLHWLTPRLVCEVVFQEWTHVGIMRQPIFVGLRKDKAPEAVQREEARTVPQVLEAAAGPASRRKTPALMPTAERTVKPVARAARPSGGGQPSLTNLDKVYWPHEGYTKGDVVAYYRGVAPVLLPYLRDRPESLHRHPNGITGKSFFQKDVSRQPPPEWVTTVRLPPDSRRSDITYLLCQDEATLLYLANLGCIELNPWNARVGSLEQPDYLVIDLDPVEVSFARVIEAAVAVRNTLERAGAPSVCKTSGKRGLHVFVPLGARYSTEHARQFAELIARLVQRQLPDSTSVERRPAARRGLVYLDFLQNRRGQTLAAPYSVRPYAGATVSTPLRWQEVTRGLDPARFTMRTLARRLDKLGDLWQPILGPGVDLAGCLERLAKA